MNLCVSSPLLAWLDLARLESPLAQRSMRLFSDMHDLSLGSPAWALASHNEEKNAHVEPVDSHSDGVEPVIVAQV